MAAPLAIYVHLPWCVRKCPYCDFNSHAAPSVLPERDYVDALLADLETDLDLAGGRTVASVFLGGGTPSLFSPEEIGRLLAGLAARLPFAPGAEVTMEANPGTIEHGRFSGYAAAGVNRVSLGAQSFDAGQLARLGRIHGPEDTGRAVAELRQAGIGNFNLDLMYALPEQVPAGALADLEAGLALGPAHLSHYQLTLEPGTAFFHRPPPLPDDDVALEMQLACQDLLHRHGYRQYEVSAWARPGRECRHNLNYWRYGDYIGIGAGAHGKLTADGRVWRSERPRLPRDYMRRVAAGDAAERRIVPAEELPFEFMLNALRLDEGFRLADFTAATGLASSAVEPALARLAARGLLLEDAGHIRPSALGFRFLNDLQAEFLPSPAAKLCTAAAGLAPGRDFHHIVTDLR